MLPDHPSKAAESYKSLVRSAKVEPLDLLHDRPQAVQGPNRGYRKFILLAHQRSGSSMMVDTLAKHPQILSFGELFVPGRIDFEIEGYDPHSAKLLALRNARPLQFLEEFVFSSYSNDIKAVGFKLFPDQIDNFSFRCVWKWLKRNPDIKIIYLTRRNLLATYASLQIAKRSGVFAIKNESERVQATIKIKPRKCLAEWRKRKRYHQLVEKKIKEREMLKWIYEDFTQSPDQHLRQVQQFLGVDVSDLKISTVKQEVRPLSAVIENYYQLQQHFSGTQWEQFFDLPPLPQPLLPASTRGAMPAFGSERTPGRKTARLRAGIPSKMFSRRSVMASALALSFFFVGLFFVQIFGSKVSAEDQTVTAINQTAARIEQYVQQHRELPTALDGLAASNSESKQATDAWSRPIKYKIIEPDTFELVSYGADGAPGGSGEGADIVRTYQVVAGQVRDLR
ncbi:MAG TPA: sulfotransferase [Pirellulales bacterium]|nr:sulfotransferase [Pirellulales bacterium]